MNILAIDTSGPSLGTAILKDGVLVYEATAQNRLTHSVNLMPMVEEALTRADMDISAIDLFAAVKGPGSFTGVRIGISTIKGMAHGAGKLCIGIDALEAFAAGVGEMNALICPVQDARAGQVYGAAFEGGPVPRRVLPDQAQPLEDFVAAAEKAADGGQLFFLGDGVKPNRERIAALLGEKALFAPPQQNFLRPGVVAYLASLTAGEAVDALSLKPLYLRAPQAERERARRLEQKHEC